MDAFDFSSNGKSRKKTGSACPTAVASLGLT